jgi:glucose-1-phosphate adenylyltransferase
MRKQTVAVVLAGGRVGELAVLTAKRPKSAVPFWGMYRIIDFVLSNLMLSGIEVVGVLSQYRPYSLIAHLAGGSPWDFTGRTREMRILSPFKGSDDSDWYRGTADAVYQNLNFIENYAPEQVVIASGDHIYSMDYRPMIRQHLATRADLTIAFKRVPRAHAHLFGTAVLDPSGRVVRYEEKASHPEGDLASLTIYVFDAEVLRRRVTENAREGRTYQIYSEIIPRMVAEGAPVFGYVFGGYWEYARTLDAYYEANVGILGPSAPDLAAWQVRTNLHGNTVADPPPALFRRGGAAHASLVCSGATLAGSVERSILSPGVVVEAGATVRDSILMHGCVVGAGATVDRAILDKAVRVERGAQVGCGEAAPNPDLAATLTGGVTVVGKGTVVPRAVRIGRNCMIAPDLRAEDWTSTEVVSGTTVAK